MADTEFHLRQSTEVAAHPDRVWDALVDDTAAWWGAPYLLLDGPSAVRMPLRAGEPVVEQLGDATALWGTVTICAPGRVYAWDGQMGMGAGWEGEVRFDLEPTPAGARITVRQDAARRWGGDDVAGMRASYDAGWADLLERLRLLVETGARHGSAGLNTAPAFAFEASTEDG